jgi:Tfp pilus assembly pilus retraction ATPase PilT
MEDVGLPKDVVERLRAFVMKKSGLGLVTGPTGSGKSTTLASLIEWVRTNSTRNIVTIEDPIEYTYPDTAQSPDGPEGSEVPSPSIITQQEVGMHIGSFAQGLRDALRKNPDIILIGEIRDTETMQTCVEAAQTGHLILSTLHTRGAAKTLTRVAGLFPAEKAKGEIENLAECLLFILSQGLIPGERDGKKLVCCEFLQNTDTATRSAISKYGAGETSALDDLLGRAGNTEWDNQLKALLDDRQISDESYREFRKKGPEEVS